MTTVSASMFRLLWPTTPDVLEVTRDGVVIGTWTPASRSADERAAAGVIPASVPPSSEAPGSYSDPVSPAGGETASSEAVPAGLTSPVGAAGRPVDQQPAFRTAKGSHRPLPKPPVRRKPQPDLTKRA